MWQAILQILARGLSVIDKFLPSWEWKGGQAAAEAKAAGKALERARKANEIKDRARTMSDAERAEWLLRRDGGS